MNRSGATSVAPPHSSLNTLINPNDLMSFSFASSETCSKLGLGTRFWACPLTDKVNDNTAKGAAKREMCLMFMRMQVWLEIQRRRKLGRFLWMPNGFSPLKSGTVPKPTAGTQCKILKTASRSNMPSVVVAFPRPFAFLSASRR